MADSSSSSTIVWVLLAALVVWFLVNKTSTAIKKVNTSVKQTYTTGTAVAAVVTNAAPALGTFLSNLAKGATSSSSSGSGLTSGDDGGYDISSYYSDSSSALSDDTVDFA